MLAICSEFINNYIGQSPTEEVTIMKHKPLVACVGAYALAGAATAVVAALVTRPDRDHPDREEPKDTWHDASFVAASGVAWPLFWYKSLTGVVRCT